MGVIGLLIAMYQHDLANAGLEPCSFVHRCVIFACLSVSTVGATLIGLTPRRRVEAGAPQSS
jgi:hypothetical protein